VFPVVDADKRLLGLVTSEAAQVLAAQVDDARWTIVADMMQPAVAVRREDDLHTATKLLVESGLRELPVIDAERRVIGFLDEAEIAKLHLTSASRAETSSS
jgi:CIC family chloride channel protein